MLLRIITALVSINAQPQTPGYLCPMKPDVTDRAGLEKVLAHFYEKVLQDELIGHFFTQVVLLDLEKHLPVIADFWESVVLGTRGYERNVMELHQRIHHLAAIRKPHLDRWVQVFTQTIDEHFEGPNATLMAQRARSIATLMDIKLNHSGVGRGE